MPVTKECVIYGDESMKKQPYDEDIDASLFTEKEAKYINSGMDYLGKGYGYWINGEYQNAKQLFYFFRRVEV